jgi:phage shock protein E
MPIPVTRIAPVWPLIAGVISGAGLAIALAVGPVGPQLIPRAVAQTSETGLISPPDLQKQLQAGPEKILLIDVRTLEEFQAGHLTGAVHVPLADIVNGVNGVVNGGVNAVAQIRDQLADRQLIVYCRSGRRSQLALEKLRSAGLSGQSLSGGLIEWRQQVDPALPSP